MGAIIGGPMGRAVPLAIIGCALLWPPSASAREAP